ncbi:purine-nucleoside phosphorylase [Amedibacillus sp. YH-ame6]
MASAHNRADAKDIANVVLMPGDPLRAKYIAETYLKDVIQFNDIRNMLGFSGTYRGKRISVMGSGMGCGSMGIYAHELYHKYDVDIILRIGSCGAYSTQLQMLDVFLAQSAYSESTYASTYSGENLHIVESEPQLNEHIITCAKEHQFPLKIGRVHTSDCFYHKVKEDLVDLVEHKGCLCVDMESFALFHIAHCAGKQAATLLTVSDHSITKEKVSAQAREQRFDTMMTLALGSIIEYAK